MKFILTIFLATVTSVPTFFLGHHFLQSLHHHPGHQYNSFRQQPAPINNHYTINYCSNNNDCACTNTCVDVGSKSGYSTNTGISGSDINSINQNTIDSNKQSY